MAVILLPQSTFEHFSACLPDAPEEETIIRLRLHQAPRPGTHAMPAEVAQPARLAYLSQLVKGKLNFDEFNLKIELMLYRV